MATDHGNQSFAKRGVFIKMGEMYFRNQWENIEINKKVKNKKFKNGGKCLRNGSGRISSCHSLAPQQTIAIPVYPALGDRRTS